MHPPLLQPTSAPASALPDAIANALVASAVSLRSASPLTTLAILRGKRLGFSLRDIAKYLDLYRADATGAEQLQSLLSTVGARIAQLGQQRDALAQTLDELHEIQHQATERLMARKAS